MLWHVGSRAGSRAPGDGLDAAAGRERPAVAAGGGPAERVRVVGEPHPAGGAAPAVRAATGQKLRLKKQSKSALELLLFAPTARATCEL